MYICIHIYIYIYIERERERAPPSRDASRSRDASPSSLEDPPGRCNHSKHNNRINNSNNNNNSNNICVYNNNVIMITIDVSSSNHKVDNNNDNTTTNNNDSIHKHTDTITSDYHTNVIANQHSRGNTNHIHNTMNIINSNGSSDSNTTNNDNTGLRTLIGVLESEPLPRPSAGGRQLALGGHAVLFRLLSSLLLFMYYLSVPYGYSLLLYDVCLFCWRTC